MTIRHLAYRFAHQFNGGAVALAVLMGKGEKVLQNKLNPNNDQHLLNVDEFEMLADFTNNNLSAAEYFAAKCNAVVVTLPEGDLGDMALLDLFMKSLQEFTDVHANFREAYADGNFTEQEFNAFRCEVNQAVAALLKIEKTVKELVQ